MLNSSEGLYILVVSVNRVDWVITHYYKYRMDKLVIDKLFT